MMKSLPFFAALSLITICPPLAQGADRGVTDEVLNARIDQLKTNRLALEADNRERGDKAKDLRETRLAKRATDTAKAKDAIAANEAALEAAGEIIRIHTTQCDVVKARRAGKNPGDTTEHDRLLADASRTRQQCLARQGTLQNALILVGGELPSAEETKLATDMRAAESAITTLTGEIARLRLELDLKPAMRQALANQKNVVGADDARQTKGGGEAQQNKFDASSEGENRNPRDKNTASVATPATPTSTPEADGVKTRSNPAVDPFIGTFSTDKYTLTLTAGTSGYTGTLVTDKTTRDVIAIRQSDGLHIYIRRNDGSILDMPTKSVNGDLQLGNDSGVSLHRQ